MRCATVLGVATFAWILFRARGRPLRGQRRYVAHRQHRSDADRLDTVVDSVKRHSLPLRLLEMQGEFEKMRRGANCNRAKTGSFSMACMGLSLLTEQGDNHCLAGTFRGKRVQNRESHIRSSDAGILVGSDRADARRLGHSINMVELNSHCQCRLAKSAPSMCHQYET